NQAVGDLNRSELHVADNTRSKKRQMDVRSPPPVSPTPHGNSGQPANLGGSLALPSQSWITQKLQNNQFPQDRQSPQLNTYPRNE
ncbi:hypothetical protein KI387_029748, partial [Taxus chinensis]